MVSPLFLFLSSHRPTSWSCSHLTPSSPSPYRWRVVPSVEIAIDCKLGTPIGATPSIWLGYTLTSGMYIPKGYNPSSNYFLLMYAHHFLLGNIYLVLPPFFSYSFDSYYFLSTHSIPLQIPFREPWGCDTLYTLYTHDVQRHPPRGFPFDLILIPLTLLIPFFLFIFHSFIILFLGWFWGARLPFTRGLTAPPFRSLITFIPSKYNKGRPPTPPNQLFGGGSLLFFSFLFFSFLLFFLFFFLSFIILFLGCFWGAHLSPLEAFSAPPSRGLHY
jgi:hypothetical protein